MKKQNKDQGKNMCIKTKTKKQGDVRSGGRSGRGGEEMSYH